MSRMEGDLQEEIQQHAKRGGLAGLDFNKCIEQSVALTVGPVLDQHLQNIRNRLFISSFTARVHAV